MNSKWCCTNWNSSSEWTVSCRSSNYFAVCDNINSCNTCWWFSTVICCNKNLTAYSDCISCCLLNWRSNCYIAINLIFIRECINCYLFTVDCKFINNLVTFSCLNINCDCWAGFYWNRSCVSSAIDCYSSTFNSINCYSVVCSFSRSKSNLCSLKFCINSVDICKWSIVALLIRKNKISWILMSIIAVTILCKSNCCCKSSDISGPWFCRVRTIVYKLTFSVCACCLWNWSFSCYSLTVFSINSLSSSKSWIDVAWCTLDFFFKLCTLVTTLNSCACEDIEESGIFSYCCWWKWWMSYISIRLSVVNAVLYSWCCTCRRNA